MSEQPFIIIPRTMPIGELIANMKHMHCIHFMSFALSSEIPIDIPAIPLWIKIAMKILKVEANVVQRPRASPSKKECMDRATMIMNPYPFSYFLASGSIQS